MKAAVVALIPGLLAIGPAMAQTAQSEQAVQSAVRDTRDRLQREQARPARDYVDRDHYGRRAGHKHDRRSERRSPDRG
jgi:hypothetical protein